MPKIPVLSAEGPQIGGGAAPFQGGYTPRDAAAANAGLTEFGKDLGAAATSFAKVEAQQRKAASDLEADDALQQLKIGYALEAAKTKAAGTPGDVYAQTVGGQYDTLASRLLQGLRYPEAKQKFQTHLLGLRGTLMVDAVHEGVKLQNAQIEGKAAEMDAEDLNTAVYGGTVQEQADAYVRLRKRNDDLVARGIRSGEQGAAHTKGTLAAIEEGGALRDSYNPDLLPSVMTKLTTTGPGAYMHIPAVQRMTLAQQIANRIKTEQNNYDAKIASYRKGLMESAVTDLTSQAKDPGADVAMLTAKLDALRKDYPEMGHAEYTATYHIITKKPDEAPSEKAVYDDLVIGTENGSRTRKDVIRAHALYVATNGANGISTKDMEHFLGKIEAKEGRDRSLRAEERTVANQESERVRARLRAHLGIPDLASKFDPIQAKLYPLALDELTSVEKRFGGDVIKVNEYFEKVMAPALDRAKEQEAQLSVDNMRAYLGSSNPADLQAREWEASKGRVPESVWRARMNNILKLKQLENQADQYGANRKATTGGRRDQ